MSEMPRRIMLEQNTPAELAIRKAIMAVEVVGAAPDLTDVVIKLNAALEALADYIDAPELEQVFGYTPPGPKTGEAFVPFMQAFRVRGGGAFEFVLRNTEGQSIRVRVPSDEVRQLVKALS